MMAETLRLLQSPLLSSFLSCYACLRPGYCVSDPTESDHASFNLKASSLLYPRGGGLADTDPFCLLLHSADS